MALEEEGRRLSDGGRAETQSKKKLAPKQAKAAQSAARAAAASRHGRRSNDSAPGAEGEDAPAAAAAAAAAPKGRGPRGAKGKTPKMQKAKGTTAKCQHGRRKADCAECGGSAMCVLLSFRSPCGCFGLAVSSSRSCRHRQPSCGGRRWMRTVRRCGRGSPTPVLLLCTQTHPAKDVGAASACAARADTVHRSCVLAHEVTLPRPCTRAGLNGDPDAWNSSSYDGYGTEYSGYNGFAVTGMETSEPTGGMRIRGWVRIRGWGVGCST